jgi:hypothetical protein
MANALCAESESSNGAKREGGENKKKQHTSCHKTLFTNARALTPPVRVSGTLFFTTSPEGEMVHALCAESASAAMDPAETLAPHELVGHEVVGSAPLTHPAPFQYHQLLCMFYRGIN